MAKLKIEPPPPLLASDEDRRLAAQTIIAGHVKAQGQAWLCCDIPVGAAALLLARHELALEPACPHCGYQGTPAEFDPTEGEAPAAMCAGCGEWLDHSSNPERIPDGKGSSSKG